MKVDRTMIHETQVTMVARRDQMKDLQPVYDQRSGIAEGR